MHRTVVRPSSCGILPDQAPRALGSQRLPPCDKRCPIPGWHVPDYASRSLLTFHLCQCVVACSVSCTVPLFGHPPVEPSLSRPLELPAPGGSLTATKVAASPGWSDNQYVVQSPHRWLPGRLSWHTDDASTKKTKRLTKNTTPSARHTALFCS